MLFFELIAAELVGNALCGVQLVREQQLIGRALLFDRQPL